MKTVQFIFDSVLYPSEVQNTKFVQGVERDNTMFFVVCSHYNVVRVRIFVDYTTFSVTFPIFFCTVFAFASLCYIKKLPKFLTSVVLIHPSIFLHVISSLIVSHFLFNNCYFPFSVFGYFNEM